MCKSELDLGREEDERVDVEGMVTGMGSGKDIMKEMDERCLEQ